MPHWVGSVLPPQAGTEVCVKILVPQTGNAVDGFCPNVLQDCDQPLTDKTVKNKQKNMILPTHRMAVKIQMNIEQTNSEEMNGDVKKNVTARNDRVPLKL